MRREAVVEASAIGEEDGSGRGAVPCSEQGNGVD